MNFKDGFFLGNDKNSNLGLKEIENNYDYDPSTYKFDENLQNDGHTAVVRQITNNSEVLDVGCASGLIGYILKEYKQCTVDGVEYDKKAYEIAKSKNIYRDIYNFSISETNSKEYINFVEKSKKYDFIIFADVLEHLVDPWNAIINASKMLKKGGSIIVSIPNISHIDIIKALIDNEFNYTRWGILDSTHLRFFTASSFTNMLKNISEEEKVYFDVKLCEKVLIKPPYFTDDDYFKMFNINNNLEEYLALQNIFKLTLVKDKKQSNYEIKNKNKNIFEKILKDYNEKTDLIRSLQEENTELKNNYQNTRDQLDKVLNSKGWKLLEKLRKIKKR